MDIAICCFMFFVSCAYYNGLMWVLLLVVVVFLVDVFRYKDINLQSTACMLFQFKMLPWKKNCMTIHRVFGGGRNSWGGGEGRYSFMGGRGDEIYFPQQTPQSPTTTHTTFVRFVFSSLSRTSSVNRSGSTSSWRPALTVCWKDIHVMPPSSKSSCRTQMMLVPLRFVIWCLFSAIGFAPDVPNCVNACSAIRHKIGWPLLVLWFYGLFSCNWVLSVLDWKKKCCNRRYTGVVCRGTVKGRGRDVLAAFSRRGLRKD